jgi:hypothetical protein
MDGALEYMHATGPVADVAVVAMPKRGHTPDEYEDAYAVSAADAWPLYAAVTDGATEAAFSRYWANVLANGWINETPSDPEEWGRRLPAWQAQWSAWVANQVRQQAWYAAAKAEQGAFAAFLGLTVYADRTWQAMSQGDCVVLHLRSGALEEAWPISTPDAFTHRPPLVASRPSAETGEELIHSTGTWADGDIMLLASDAIGAWLLRTNPAAVLEWDAETASSAIRSARSRGDLANDDVTLIRLTLHAP